MLSKTAISKEINKAIFVSDGINNIGQNYIFVTLGKTLKVYREEELDICKTNETETIVIPEDGLVLEPNTLYLGRTNEYTKTYGFVPMLSGLLDLALLGVEIHVTAGFGDNGFEGTWTLEIVCANPTRVYPNMPIGRIYYYPLIGNPAIEYHGKYFGQIEPTESRIQREQTDIKKLVKRSNEDVN